MRINDYALIGDGRSAALVSCAGSIDWLCWPRFDSPPIFAALLDPDGGSWCIRPRAQGHTTRRYVDDTNVLETLFGFHVMDPSVYYITEIPSDPQLPQIVLIAGTAFLLTVLATIYPALRGAATHPAEALRYE